MKLLVIFLSIISSISILATSATAEDEKSQNSAIARPIYDSRIDHKAFTDPQYSFIDFPGRVPGRIRELLLRFTGKHKSPELTNSILLYGHTGNGMARLAEAFAGEAQAAYLHIPTSRFESSWDVDRTFNSLLAYSHKFNKKVVLCLRYLDAAGTECSRYPAWHDAQQALITRLIELKNNKSIFTIATSHKPQMLIPAFRDCSILAENIELPFPNFENRKDIIEYYLHTRPLSISQQQLATEIALAAQKTKGLARCDLRSMVMMEVTRSSDFRNKNDGPPTITSSDIENGVKKIVEDPIRTYFIEKNKNEERKNDAEGKVVPLKIHMEPED